MFENRRIFAMPSKPRYVRMRQDDVAWERSDEEAELWERSLLKAQVYRVSVVLSTSIDPVRL